MKEILRRLGRAAEPLFRPDSVERRDREDAQARRLGRMTTSLERLAEQVGHLSQRVDHFDGDEVKHLRNAVSTLEWSTRRQATFGQKVLESAQHRTDHTRVRDHVIGRIREVARRGGPIVVGPWTGEVGFELLYWAPFVRWAIQRFSIDPDRVTLLSRGGTSSWYGIDGARYRDVLEFCAPEEFRRSTLKERKQRTLRLFDRQLLRRARREIDGRASVVHPAMMYALYAPYWARLTSSRWVQQSAAFARIRPPVIQGLHLPPNYVAVRFYFSKCFPNTPENQAVVSSLIEALTLETHVVLLGSGVSMDEHHDVTIRPSDRVHAVAHLMRPETNLAVQTAVIGGAQAFIGTYGGFCYLAPLCGVNTIAWYSRRNYYAHHLDFAQQLFDTVGGGSLTVMDAATSSWMLQPNRR